jgi:hypothetical protein
LSALGARLDLHDIGSSRKHACLRRFHSCDRLQQLSMSLFEQRLFLRDLGVNFGCG